MLWMWPGKSWERSKPGEQCQGVGGQLGAGALLTPSAHWMSPQGHGAGKSVPGGQAGLCLRYHISGEHEGARITAPFSFAVHVGGLLMGLKPTSQPQKLKPTARKHQGVLPFALPSLLLS